MLTHLQRANSGAARCLRRKDPACFKTQRHGVHSIPIPGLETNLIQIYAFLQERKSYDTKTNR